MSDRSTCDHLDQVAITEIPARADVDGCEDCLAMGGRWVHLRVCRSCGKVGCCDSSPNQHATGHARTAGHPIMSSIEPGETWSWCVIDEVGFVLG